MATKGKGTKGTTKGKGTAPKATTKAVAQVRNLAALPAATVALLATVGHMVGGGPSATQYVGLTAKGGAPVYCVRKVGGNAGHVKGKRYAATVHMATATGFGPAVAQVPSVSAGWVGTAGSGVPLAN